MRFPLLRTSPHIDTRTLPSDLFVRTTKDRLDIRAKDISVVGPPTRGYFEIGTIYILRKATSLVIAMARYGPLVQFKGKPNVESMHGTRDAICGVPFL